MAALLAIILLDYPDFVLILALLVMNATISYREEASADKVHPSPLFHLSTCRKARPSGWLLDYSCGLAQAETI